VNWVGGKPNTAELAVEVDSLQVVCGAGGVKGLSAAEKILVRANALKSLSASHFPEICFTANSIDQANGRSGEGYRLSGTLLVRGKEREHVVDLRTEDLGNSWRLSVESKVRQSEYRIKPYSMLMGSLQVADEVTVSFAAVQPKDE
jgi:polyisoprenoid-binding protein YceI